MITLLLHMQWIPSHWACSSSDPE
ncbi:hypothetical protein JMJ77_0009896 [Colletotrichum scovillei]|uniref:Uncharacterized protein n=1 Tax=Colletotrichum scovillei TaxID=1209932 RepID=A0A9P7U5G6_9PEZI|nr:hypothetical protein JMJ78_0005977 [Colletotrichum scovillei]KAG7040435.1 hypothetical protein JMJ77_0009896 [Colletotrichum scovillei]KAG7060483.1 hypothetical protein JMJ76_0009284 [Colletotrichum scovillei]